MSLERVLDEWQEVREAIAKRWPKLTKRDLDKLQDGRDALIAALRNRYSWSAERANQELDELDAKLGHGLGAELLGRANEVLLRGRNGLQGLLGDGKEQASDLYEKGRESLRTGRERLEGGVRTRPWTAVGIAAGVGALAALFLTRGRS